MSTLNANADRSHDDDDDDDFGEVESRPLLGWFLMAVALVAMAFLIGGRDEVSSAGQSVTVTPETPTAVVTLSRAAAVAGMAFGG